LKLALLGPSFAFIPPLYAFNDLPGMKCEAGIHDDVPEEYYLDRIRTVSPYFICYYFVVFSDSRQFDDGCDFVGKFRLT
jgi:hypothetical protein